MGWTEAPAVKRKPPGKRPLPSPLATAPRLDSTGIQPTYPVPSAPSPLVPASVLVPESHPLCNCPSPRRASLSVPPMACAPHVAARAIAAPRVAFPATIRGRRPEPGDYQAQWLACLFPCQRLRRALAARPP